MLALKKLNKVHLSIVGLLVIALAGGVFLLGQQQIFRSNAAPATTLRINTPTTPPALGEASSMYVEIDTGTNRVIGTQLEIKYDNTKIEVTGLSIGEFFTGAQEYGKNIDNSTGKLNVAYYLSATSAAKRGNGNVLKIDFTPLSNGFSTVEFTDNTIVAAYGEGGTNVLQTKIPGSLTVGSVITPTPSSSPTSRVTTTAPTEEPESTQAPTTTQTTRRTSTTTSSSGGTGSSVTTTSTTGGSSSTTGTSGGTGTGAGTGTGTGASAGTGSSGSTVAPTAVASPTVASNSGTYTENTTSNLNENPASQSSQLPTTATKEETLLGIWTGIGLLVISILIRFRKRIL